MGATVRPPARPRTASLRLHALPTASVDLALILATVLLLGIVVAGCDSKDTPTVPGPAILDLSGPWSTDDLVGPCESEPGEDWSEVALVLEQSGRQVSGEIVTANGRRRPPAGRS